MTTSLVHLENGQPVTTSLLVAERFEKQHKHVLDRINKLQKELPPEHQPNFRLCYQNNELQNNKALPYYQITRDGFTLLAMGFTGRAALQFKLNYIDAFNQLEASVHLLTAERLRLLESMKEQLVSQNPDYLKIIHYRAARLSGEEIGKLLGYSARKVYMIINDMKLLDLLPKPRVSKKAPLLTMEV